WPLQCGSGLVRVASIYLPSKVRGQARFYKSQQVFSSCERHEPCRTSRKASRRGRSSHSYVWRAGLWSCALVTSEGITHFQVSVTPKEHSVSLCKKRACAR